MVTSVFVDADALFSRTLRDWLFLIRNQTAGGMYAVGSSEDVLSEVIARFRDRKPSASGAQIANLRQRLVDNLDEVVDDYEVNTWMLEGDEGDAHVRAACIGGAFDVLLTCDKILLADGETHPNVSYEPMHPDAFFVLADDSGPEHVRAVVRQQLDYFIGKHGEADLPAALRSAGCPQFAERVNAHVHALHS